MKAKGIQHQLIPFNAWSRERIIMGKKCCMSRHKKYADPLVKSIGRADWGYIRKTHFESEGANSPEELQKVIEEIYHRKVPDDEVFYIHWFDNVEMAKRLVKEKELSSIGRGKGEVLSQGSPLPHQKQAKKEEKP